MPSTRYDMTLNSTNILAVTGSGQIEAVDCSYGDFTITNCEVNGGHHLELHCGHERLLRKRALHLDDQRLPDFRRHGRRHVRGYRHHGR